MAASDDDEYGEFEKEKPAEQVKQTTDEVKNTLKDDSQNKVKSVRDKTKDLKQQAGETVGKGQEKLAPYFSTAKEKMEKLEGKKPAVQEEAKEMLDQAKHTVSKVVQQESKDVVEGVKRLAKDEKAFHDAAHKVAEKFHHGGGGLSAGESEKHHSDSRKQEHTDSRQGEQSDVNGKNHAHHIPDFSDFSEMEEDWSDEGEGSSHHPKQHLLNEHRAAHGHQQHQPQKRKKSPLGYFKVGAKMSGKEKNKGAQDNKQGEQQQQQEQQHQQNGGHGVLGTVKSVFGQGSAGEKTMDTASNLAQKKLGQMRHVVDAQMDEAGNATAAEKKTQGVGLVQSFVCLCTCASSVHVSG